MPRGKRIDVAWLREHYPRMTDINKLLDDYEAEFGCRPTKTAVYVKANKLGIHKQPVAGRGNRAERAIYWCREPDKEEWMLAHDHGQRCDLLSEEFREQFGFGLSRSQINGFRSSRGTQKRRSHGGGRPLAPVGTERVGKDGYVIVKVRKHACKPQSKDNWMLKHVWVYEQHYGPLPEGHHVYFADGDKDNFDPCNLVAVPRRLVGVINSLRASGVTWHDRETLQAVVTLAELRVARNDAEASMVRTCPCCGKKFDNRSRRKVGTVSTAVCPECGAAGRRPPSGRGGRARTYDHEKIRKLHRMGWRNEDIAAEVGCSRATVSNVVHERRKKKEEKA